LSFSVIPGGDASVLRKVIVGRSRIERYGYDVISGEEAAFVTTCTIKAVINGAANILGDPAGSAIGLLEMVRPKVG
jgi:hypothetical protein